MLVSLAHPIPWLQASLAYTAPCLCEQYCEICFIKGSELNATNSILGIVLSKAALILYENKKY